METRIYLILCWSRLAGRENKERAKRDEIDQRENRVTRERERAGRKVRAGRQERGSREQRETHDTRERPDRKTIERSEGQRETSGTR